MANVKFGSVWKLLNEYNFQIDIENNSDLICCICKNLLKNAHHGVCGCLYCQECIKLFLSTDEKYCPGKNSQCKEYMINIALNLQVDHLVNKKIAGVIVKCPMDFCQFKDRLSDMEHHIATHINDNRSEDCLRELEDVKKEIVSLREDIHEAQSHNQNQMSALREELGKLSAVTEFCKEEIRKLKSRPKSSGDQINLVTGGDIDEELDLFDYTDEEFSMDVDGWRKKKLSILEPMFTVNETDLVPVSHSSGIDYRSLIVTEVNRQTGDLRNALAEQEAELNRLRNELRNRRGNHGNNSTEPIDLTDSDYSKFTPDQTPEDQIPAQVDNAATQDGKSTRRRLKRDLPTVPESIAAEKCSSDNIEKSSKAVPVIVSPEKVLQTTPDHKVTQLHNSSTAVTPKFPHSDSKTAPGLLSNSKGPPAPVVAKPPPEDFENSKKKPKHVAFSTPKPKGNVITVPVSKAVIHPVVLQRNSERPFVRATRSRRGRGQSNATMPHSRSRNVSHSMDEHRAAMDPLSFPSMRSYTPFEFKVDNFASKIFQSKQGCHSIYSQPFYSSKNGYKLCLRVDPNADRFGSNAYLGVFFCVLQGEFDSHLPWPMKLEVTVSLIDQAARVPYTSRTFDFESAPENWKHVFSKPSVGNSGVFWFGTPQFIHFDFLYNNSSLVFQDSIIIRCSTGSADLF